MATVEVTFTPLPAHVRTARLVATAVARRSGVDEALLDEVRLAVGEACSRAVEAHRRHCPAEPVRIEMTSADERFVVTVSDHAPTAPGRPAAPAQRSASDDSRSDSSDGASGSGEVGASGGGASGDGYAEVGGGYGGGHENGSAIPAGFGLAVISGLAEDVRVLSTSSGVSVRMSWPSTATTS
jgi:anti-sigma regulatory factor (Ser/Thr protein kinase)